MTTDLREDAVDLDEVVAWLQTCQRGLFQLKCRLDNETQDPDLVDEAIASLDRAVDAQSIFSKRRETGEQLLVQAQNREIYTAVNHAGAEELELPDFDVDGIRELLAEAKTGSYESIDRARVCEAQESLVSAIETLSSLRSNL